VDRINRVCRGSSRAPDRPGQDPRSVQFARRRRTARLGIVSKSREVDQDAAIPHFEPGCWPITSESTVVCRVLVNAEVGKPTDESNRISGMPVVSPGD